MERIVTKIPYIQIITKSQDQNLQDGTFKYKVTGLEYDTDHWTHSSTDWTVVDAQDNPVFESLNDSNNKISIVMNKDNFVVGDEYTIITKLNFTNNDDSTKKYTFALNQKPYTATVEMGKEVDHNIPNNYVEDLIWDLKDTNDVVTKLNKLAAVELEKNVASVLYVNAKEKGAING
jgi:hypothetical protein